MVYNPTLMTAAPLPMTAIRIWRGSRFGFMMIGSYCGGLKGSNSTPSMCSTQLFEVTRRLVRSTHEGFYSAKAILTVGT